MSKDVEHFLLFRYVEVKILRPKHIHALLRLEPGCVWAGPIWIAPSPGEDFESSKKHREQEKKAQKKSKKIRKESKKPSENQVKMK